MQVLGVGVTRENMKLFGMNRDEIMLCAAARQAIHSEKTRNEVRRCMISYGKERIAKRRTLQLQK